ncbi:hypothetical protein FHQ26_02135 [Testudinibacter sp. TR-2022]|nr:YadA-like family protein [Testudinibacter sp. TR-2022]TNH00921.1 hypothetical protein FHQ22_11730 [Pasteurellaceae bacterium Phil31]TNH10463.1 hypothetical protein FHQ25_05190 [Testudinibacter sp. TR-2022]TNH12206.1 hypothetical protein FHQ26_02135 [Testudinibacter sp. TR-2022]
MAGVFGYTPQAFAATTSCNYNSNTANGFIDFWCGPNASSSTDKSVAIGNSAQTSGTNNIQQIAIGSNVRSTGNQAIAIGNDMLSAGQGAVAIGGDDIGGLYNLGYGYTAGRGFGTTGTSNTSTGNTDYRATAALGQGAVAIGGNAQGLTKGSTAIGPAATAGQINQTQVGTGGGLGVWTEGAGGDSGAEATAVGAKSYAKAQQSTALGAFSQALSASSVAIGDSAVASNVGTFPSQGVSSRRVVGNNVDIPRPDTGTAFSKVAPVAVGAKNNVLTGGVALGYNNLVGTTNAGFDYAAYAFGNNNDASNAFAWASGFGNTANGVSSIALGAVNQANGNASIGIGREVQASKDFALAVGNVATASEVGAMAVGHSASASGQRAIAIGSSTATGSNLDATNNTKASGADAIAIGTLATGTVSNAVAIGLSANATGFDSVALGSGAQALAGGGNIAIGRGAYTNGTSSPADPANGTNISIGSAAGVGQTTTANGNVAIGGNAGQNVSGRANFAMGFQAGSNVSGTANIAFGRNAGFGGTTAAPYTQSGSVAIGDSALSSSSTGYSTALGSFAQATGQQAIAIGGGAAANAIASGNNAVAIGTVGTQATNTNTVALGSSAQASGISAIAVGNSANALGQGSVVMGSAAGQQNTQAFTIAIGSGAGTTTAGTNNTENTAIGRNAGRDVTGNTNLALSSQAGQNVSGSNNFAAMLQAGQYVSGNNNIAIGQTAGRGTSAAPMTASHTVALSTGAVASQDHAIAIGRSSQAINTNAVAVGNTARARGESSIAMGNTALVHATATNAIAIGINAIAGTYSGVAIGDNARATTSGITSATAGSSTAIGRNAGANLGTALGEGAWATTNSVVIGRNATTVPKDWNSGGMNTTNGFGISNYRGAGNVVIGDNARAMVGGRPVAQASVALGYGASIVAADEADNSTNSNTLGVGSATALGGNTRITGSTGATVVGANANSTASNGSVSVGQYATAGTTAMPAEAGIAIGGARYNTNGTVLANTATRVTGEAAIAIGSALPVGTTYQNTSATAANAIALGSGAQALAANAISIGTGNVVRGANSGALGDPSYISGSGTYTIGNDNGTSAQPIAANNSGAFGNNNMMIVGGSSGIRIVGNSNDVSSSNVMVLGNNVIVATGLDGAVVLGNDSTVSKAMDTAKTDLNGLTYTYAPAGAVPADGDVVSVGKADKPRQIQNVANGQVSASSLDAINGSQLYAVADTLSKKLTHFYSVNNTTTTAGNYNNDGATGTNAMALGPDAKAVGAQSIAMGLNAQTSDGADSVAIGHNSNAATGSVAMGRGTVANGNNAVAIGLGAQATSADSDNFGGIAIGGQSKATTPTDANATATAIGYSSQATTDGALALGDTAKATANAGDVALGSNSSTAAVVNTTEATVGKLTYSGFAGTAATSTVSVGEAGKERTLTNVAAGRISQTSTDAINGSQLYATNLTLGKVATTAVGILGGNAALAADGTITMTNIGDTNKNTVHEAIKAAKTEVAAGTNVTSVVKTDGINGQAVYTVNADGTTVSAATSAVTVTADPKDGTNITNYKVDLSQETKDSIAKADGALQSWTAQVNGATAATINKDNTTLNFVNGDNILITNDGGIKVSTSMTPSFTTVTATESITAPTISTGNGGPSMSATDGINAGNQKITNVTAGTENTDAVNYSQLKAVQDAAKTSSVVKGTNVASVTSTTTDVNTEYTVNADGTTVSAATTSAVKVTAGDKNATTNVTDYALDLTDKTKEDIAKGVTASEDIASKGLVFAGDSGDNATRKLGETLNVKGGNTTEANLTDNNIGVVSNGADTLTVKLAKDVNLGATGSLTINSNKLDKDGLDVVSGNTSVAIKPAKLGDPVSVVATDGTNTAVYGAKGLSFTETNGTPLANSPSISQTGINAGNQQITAVKSGVDGTTLADAAGDTLTNAANIGDVKNAITNLETQYQGDNAAVTVTRKPAEVLSVKGGAAADQLTDGNIGTVGATDGSITVKLAKNLAGLTDVETESLSVGDKVTITSAGIDAGGLPITNVADGVNDDDAVNVSQLNKVAGGWEIGNDITAAKVGNVAAGKRVNFVSGNEETTLVDVTQDANGNSVVTVEAAPGAIRYSNTNTAAGGNASNGDQFTATNSVTLMGANGDTSSGVTINNVAPGTLSADSKQAVNGAQLFETNTNVATNAANIAKGINFGGTEGSNKYALGDTINVKGDSNITSTTIAGGAQLALANTVTIGNATTGKPVTINGEAGTVGGLTNKTFDVANITSGQAATEDQLKAVSEVASAGWNVQANDTKAENVAPKDTVTFKDGKNILVTQEGKTLTIATSDNPEFTSVKIGDVTNNTTLTSSADGLSVGGDKITNVGSGTVAADSTDAVNGGDVYTAIQGTASQYQGDNTTVTVTRKPAEVLSITGGATDLTDNNIGTVGNADGSIAVKLAKNLTGLEKVTVGDSELTTNGLTINNGTAGNTVSLTKDGLNNGGNKITNVATGTADTDAVNVAQLNEVAGAAAKPLTFAGNSRVAADGTSDVERKLGETLKIYGATDGSLTALSTDAATAGTYSGKNIQTITDKTTGAVQIQLAENPQFTSVKIGDTTNNTTLTSTANGLDVGDDKITNLKSGLDGTTLGNASGAVLTNAVNVADLQSAVTGLTDSGFKVNADNADVKTHKLGNELAIVAGNATDTSSNNLATKVEQDAQGKTTVTVSMKNAPTFTGTVTAPTFVTSGNNPVTIGDGKVTGLVAPTAGSDATNKDYVDGKVGDAVGAVTLNTAGDTGTGSVNLKTQSLAINGTTDQIESTASEQGVTLKLSSKVTDSLAKADNAVQYDDPAVKDKVTLGGTDSTTPVQLTNVKAGDLSANSTDAVNGSQLFATNQNIETLQKGWNVTTSQSDGTASGSAVTVVKAEDTVTIDAGKNIVITQDGQKVSIATSATPEFSSVKIGDATNSTTLTSTANGLDVGGDKITNVGSGTVADGSTDAVNGGDVYTAIQNTETQYQGDNTAVTVKRKPTDVLSVKGGAAADQLTDNNIGTVGAEDGSITVKLAKNLTGLEKVTVGDSELTTNGLTISNGTAGNPVSLTKDGLNNGGNQITNVKSGLDGTALGDAAGAVLTNAVNVADLQSAVTGLTNSGFKVNADNADVKTHKLGNELAIVAGNATETSSDNLATKVEQDAASGKTTVTVSMKESPTFKDITATSVTADDGAGNVTKLTATGTTVTDGTNTSAYGADGLVIKDKDGKEVASLDSTPIAVKDKDGNDITNVNTALNQLNSVQQAADSFAVKYDKNADGTPNKDSVTLAGTTGTPVTKNADGTFAPMSGGTALNNVASAGDITDPANAYKAVNAGDLNNQIAGITNSGIQVNADQGGVQTHKLGNELAIVAGNTTDATSSDNLLTKVEQDAASGKTTVTVSMKNAPTFTGTVTAPTFVTSGDNPVTIGAGKVSGLVAPTADGDAANKKYVDDQLTTTVDAVALNTAGDSGTGNVNLKTQTLSVTGTADQIETTAADQGIKLKLSDKVTESLAKADNAVQYDDPTKKDSVTLGGAGSTTPVQLTNVKSGLGDTALGDAAGAVLTNAVNVADLQSAVTGLTDSGFKVNADNADVKTHKLGKELAIVAGNATDTVTTNLATNVTQDADGKTTVTVSMKESPTFKDITATSVTADDGAGNVTKLTAAGTEVKDAAGNSATYGATGDTIKDAAGNSTTTTAAGTVVKDAAGNTTTVAANGTTVTDGTNTSTYGADKATVGSANPVVIDGAKGTVSGLTNTAWDNSKTYTGSNTAATEGQVADAISGLTDKGLIFAANTGNNHTAKLGSTVTVKGADENTDFNKFDAGKNIMTQVDNGLIRVALAKELSGLDSVTVGKDANGNTTVLNGAGTTVTNDDGRTASYGVDGMSVKGADGTTLASVGKDGVSTTGTVKVVDGEGKTVAQLDDTAMNVAGKSVTSVNEAINQLDKAAAAAKTTVTAGDNIVVTPTTNSDGSTTYNVATAKDLKVDSVKAGDTTINNDGLTIAGGPSVTKAGIDAAGTKITNVASGDISATSTDVVNGGDVHNAIKNATSDLVDNGLKFGANSGDTYTAKLGSTVSVKGADSNTDFSKFDGGKNIMTQVDAKGNITVALAKDVEVASAKFGDTVKIDNNGINAGNTVIDGVKAGSIAAGSQQAVNGGQVHDVAQSVAKALGDGAKVNPDGTVTAPTYTITKTDGSTVTANSVGGALNYFNQEIVKPITFTGDSGSYDAKLGNTVNVKGDGKNISTSVSGNNLTISMTDTPEFSRVTTGGTVMNSNGLTTGGGNGPSLTTSGINAAGTKISNVGNATEAGDAVNFGQVQAMGNNLNRRINEVDKSARAGIAGALATAGLYQAYLPGKSMVAVGAGTYRGENALAIGVSRISDNGKIGVKLTGMSTSQGDAGGSVSVGYQW